jgi:hypothetical protein
MHRIFNTQGHFPYLMPLQKAAQHDGYGWKRKQGRTQLVSISSNRLNSCVVLLH